MISNDVILRIRNKIVKKIIYQTKIDSSTYYLVKYFFNHLQFVCLVRFARYVLCTSSYLSWCLLL